MAVSDSTRKRHVDLDHCLRFLESKNSAKQMLNNPVSRYEKFVISGLDSFLLLFQKCLRKHDVEKVLNYLRNFEIMDEADCERISCQSISDLMVTELVTMIRTKDPHAFWYFVHSLKKNALFQFFHGGIHCCVCEEVQAKEKEIDETIFEGNETTPAMVPLLKKQIIDVLERKPWKNVWVKKKKDVRRTASTVRKRFDDFRQVVGPSIREVKTAFKEFLEMAKDKKDEQSQQQPEIEIPIQDEEPAKLAEGVKDSTELVYQDEEAGDMRRPSKEKLKISAFAPTFDYIELEEGVEDSSEPVYQDEEDGDMAKPSKAKPKITAFVPTFDYIEGRKKYIAFAIVCIFTLYSYVDSVIKLIPF